MATLNLYSRRLADSGMVTTLYTYISTHPAMVERDPDSEEEDNDISGHHLPDEQHSKVGDVAVVLGMHASVQSTIVTLETVSVSVQFNMQCPPSLPRPHITSHSNQHTEAGHQKMLMIFNLSTPSNLQVELISMATVHHTVRTKIPTIRV